MAPTEPAQFDEPLVFAPNSDECDGAIIWLHGFGDKPKGWGSALKLLRVLPNWKWIHLHAPLLPQPAYGGKRMPAWGQFLSTDCIHVGSADHEETDNNGFYAASVAGVKQQIELLEKAGVPLDKIVVGGFSQGAAVALETALTGQRPIAGCIVLSGWMTPRARAALANESLKNLPLLVCHGAKDEMVGVDCAKACVDSLQAAGRQVHFEEFEALAHSSCSEELDHVNKFLFSSLCPGTSAPSIDWEQSESDDDFEDNESDDEIYVIKQALKTIQEQFERTPDAASSKSLESLQNFEHIADHAALVPIPGDLLWDWDDLLAQLGAKGAAAVFVGAAKAALEDAARDITFEEFTDRMEEHAGWEGEEKDEEAEEEDEEVDDAEEQEEGEDGPAAKRCRIDL